MIDAAEVQKLAGRYMYVMSGYYGEAGHNREALFTQLEALAYTVATILIATRGEALPFFDDALKQAIADIAKARKPDHGNQGPQGRRTPNRTFHKSQSKEVGQKKRGHARHRQRLADGKIPRRKRLHRTKH